MCLAVPRKELGGDDGMGIAFPSAGVLLRQWRKSRRESVRQWAKRLQLPPVYGVSQCKMKRMLDHFERKNQWAGPQPEVSIIDFLNGLRETCCESAHDIERFEAIALIVFNTLYYPPD